MNISRYSGVSIKLINSTIPTSISSAFRFQTSYINLTCSNTGFSVVDRSLAFWPFYASYTLIAPKMSMITLSSLQRITAPKLADMLLANANQLSSDSSVAIVDVRDDGMCLSTLFLPIQTTFPFPFEETTYDKQFLNGNEQEPTDSFNVTTPYERPFFPLMYLLTYIFPRSVDHIGGHIKSSLHFPSRSLDAMMPTLVRKLADKDVVVFHCALSQQRGPSAALQYLRAKEGASAAVARKVADEQQSASGEGEAATKKQQQTVYILDRGFVGWQEAYGPDERLTEAYRKEIWEDGY